MEKVFAYGSIAFVVLIALTAQVFSIPFVGDEINSVVGLITGK